MLWARCLRRPLDQLRIDGLAPRHLNALKFQQRQLVTLAIESSCDDTSVAVLEKDDETGKAFLHYHEKVTSDNKEFKGVNPKIALTSHQESLAPLVRKALASLPSARPGDASDASSSGGSRRLDFVSVTRGPGMRSSVSTGLDTAKGLAIGFNVPLVGVNHMQAHALTPRLVSALETARREQPLGSKPSPEFPFLSVLVSGGHTTILNSSSLSSHQILSNTVDIAAGDALDKMARFVLPEDVLGDARDVSYAKALETFVFGSGSRWDSEKTYPEYNPPANRTEEVTPRVSPYGWALPIPLANTRGGQKAFDLSMSFTGLCSAVERLMERSQLQQVSGMSLDERRRLGFEIMRVTFEHIASRAVMSLDALKREKGNADADAEAGEDSEVQTLVTSGGVAANRFLRHVLRRVLDAKGYRHVRMAFPPLEYCTDNAAMIAWAGMEMYEAGWQSTLDCLPLRKWSLDPAAEDGGIFGVGGWTRRRRG